MRTSLVSSGALRILGRGPWGEEDRYGVDALLDEPPFPEPDSDGIEVAVVAGEETDESLGDADRASLDEDEAAELKKSMVCFSGGGW